MKYAINLIIAVIFIVNVLAIAFNAYSGYEVINKYIKKHESNLLAIALQKNILDIKYHGQLLVDYYIDALESGPFNNISYPTSINDDSSRSIIKNIVSDRDQVLILSNNITKSEELSNSKIFDFLALVDALIGLNNTEDGSYLFHKETPASLIKKYRIPLTKSFEDIDDVISQKLIKQKIDKSEIINHFALSLFIQLLLLALAMYAMNRFFQKQVIQPIQNIHNNNLEIKKTGYISTHHLEDNHLIKEISLVQQQFNETSKEVAVLRRKLSQNQLDHQRLEMLPTVAHNLINPLSGIKLTAESILEYEKPEESVKTLIYDIIENVDMLTNWSRMLLYYYDDKKINPTFLVLDKAIDKATYSTNYLCSKKNIKIIKAIIPSQLNVYADASIFEQMLTCLLINAINASKIDSVININFSETADEVILEIVDNGIGLPDNFESPNKKSTRGRGLGIPFVKKVALLHENIDVVWKNNQGAGATATVTIKKYKMS